ncbi:hypothetical protein M8J75_004975 [Diaphorina citri]|nr:hypothetical protein M8J75_004975 [Diaphorina citri]
MRAGTQLWLLSAEGVESLYLQTEVPKIPFESRNVATSIERCLKFFMKYALNFHCKFLRRLREIYRRKEGSLSSTPNTTSPLYIPTFHKYGVQGTSNLYTKSKVIE